MKAAVYYRTGDPAVFSYEEVPDPLPGDDEVLIRVAAISIEGADLLQRRFVPPAATPHVVGYAAAGEIVALGRNVRGLEIGQNVTSFGEQGSHAELRAVRADRCWLLPKGMNLQTACCVPIAFGTAYQALFELGGLQTGETVLIQGAGGGVGLAAVQLAKRFGARVIGTGSSAELLAKLHPYGLDEGVNYQTEDVVTRVRALTRGRGVDLLIDPVGGAALQQGVDCLAIEGRAVMVGMVDRHPHALNAAGILTGRRRLIGCMMGFTAHTPGVHGFIQGLLAQVAAGDLKMVINRTFPLAQAAAAHAFAETRGRDIGRVVMLP